MRYRSKKMQAKYREYAKRVSALITPETLCAAAEAPEPCYGYLTPHHVKPRGRGGDLLGEIVAVCQHHNEWLSGDGQAWGYENGLLKRSWE